jgi:hypothetical protein
MIGKRSNPLAIVSETSKTPERSIDRDEPDRPSKKQKSRGNTIDYASTFIPKSDRLRDKNKKSDSKLRNLSNTQIMELMWDLVDIVEERAVKTDNWASKRIGFRDIQAGSSTNAFEQALKNFKLMQLLLAEPFAFEERAIDYFWKVETFTRKFEFRPEVVDEDFLKQIEFLTIFAEFTAERGPPSLDSGILLFKLQEFKERQARAESEDVVGTSDDEEREEVERRLADLRRDVSAKNKESIEKIRIEHFQSLATLKQRLEDGGGNKALINTLERIAAKCCKLVSEEAAKKDDPGLYLLEFHGLTDSALERV